MSRGLLLRVLMIGDIMGKPGRDIVSSLLPRLREERQIDLVIANGENTAGGRGLTESTAHELLDSGIDVITSGNHIWDNKEILPFLDSHLPILRPINYPVGVAGRGYLITRDVMVVNLMARTFMASLDCPFRAMDSLLSSLDPKPSIILVDFHGEATSEKVAMAWYLDGRVSALVGTHTHVATADTRVFPKGTAYVTDLGMTGPYNSVIGSDKDAVLKRFLTQIPVTLPVATGPCQFNSVLIDIDPTNGRAKSIVRVDTHPGKE